MAIVIFTILMVSMEDYSTFKLNILGAYFQVMTHIGHVLAVKLI